MLFQMFGNVCKTEIQSFIVSLTCLSPTLILSSLDEQTFIVDLVNACYSFGILSIKCQFLLFSTWSRCQLTMGGRHQ